MKRFFEKISIDQFSKDISCDINLYNNYNLPARTTKYSAGYDFEALSDFVLKPGESLKIPTGIKVSMYNDEVLLLLVRSSMGFKYNIRMCNQVGVIDSDYYNSNENVGHIWIKIKNEGNLDFIVKKGDKIAQGLFTKYLMVEDEEMPDQPRVSGFGSTNKE